MTGASELAAKIREYADRYALKLPKPLSEPYDLTRQWKTDSFPHADHPGCYFIFDADGDLLYIGKASLRSTVGRRLATYFLWNGKEVDPKHDGWTKTPSHIRTQPVAKAYEAASMEEFLITELQPSQNTSGIKA